VNLASLAPGRKLANCYADPNAWARITRMDVAAYTIWQDQGQWRGYLRDNPDHQVQGESFEELELKLRRLHHDLTNRKAIGALAPHRAA
jgi:hypothetical protein